MKCLAKFLSLLMLMVLLSGLLPIEALQPQAQAEEGRKSLAAAKTMTPPNIDGRLDESVWMIDQPLNAQVGEGPFADSRFGLMWDNTYLYIGVSAASDQMIHSGAGYWFDQDNINLFFDPTLHQSAPFSTDDMQIGFVYQPGTTTPEFHFGAALDNHSGKDEKKILRAIQKTDTGWSLETAVPWDMLEFDPMLQKELGIEIGVTDRYGEEPTMQRSSFWSAYQSTSFWNDTTGYGVLTLVDDNPLAGELDPVLLEEDFSNVEVGGIPYGWISDVNAGSNPFTVVESTYGDRKLAFSGSAAGKQSRIVAPVQWDNYTVEADVTFESVLNSARWAALMFRAAGNGKVPYNQMAVRQNGTYEIAYRDPSNVWSVPVTGPSPALSLNKEYTMKVRVFGNNVKEYIKPKDSEEYSLLTDSNLPSAVLLERGKIGLQADQSSVLFDNVKVTRITPDRLNLTVPSTVEALSGTITVTGSVYYSDGLTEMVNADSLRLYSSDDSILRVKDNQIYPLKEGKASVIAVYYNQQVSQEVTVTPSLTGPKVLSMTHEDGYALAIAGESLDLDDITFTANFSNFTTDSLPGSAAEWSAVDDKVIIANGTMKALEKGVYTVTAQKDDASVSLLLVVKDAEDAEYVLYEEDFDDVPEGTMPSGWVRKEGTTASAAAVKEGAFEIKASASPDNPSRVLLPEYLRVFGDYKIEADMTHLAANDSARWHSIMYRIQNDNYPYYQMAVRQNATASNGIEFAERTAANEWKVSDTGSYSEAIDAGKLYHYTVQAYGSRVQQWINDKLVVNTDSANTYARGRIGLQANGSWMKVDNIRVTLQQDALPPMPADKFVNVSKPETKISLAPSVVKELTSLDDLTVLTAEKLPATLTLYVADGLKVTDPSGVTEIGSLDSVLEAVGKSMILAFYVRDEQTVDQLTAYLSGKGIEDAFVVSDKAELVKRARTAYPIIRGIVDYSSATDLSEEDLLNIRREATVNLAKIVILPDSEVTKDKVAYLQQRLIVVWGRETGGGASKNIGIHRLITAGVNGIVTNSPASVFDAYMVYSHGTTLIRKPYIIGHRGLPTMAPENTIESDQLALDYGADFIENDIYITKDGHLVIIHDSVLDSTTNGTGKVEDHTLEEIKQLNANKPHPAGYPDVKVPTFDEQIKLVQEQKSMLMAEIKTGTPEAVDAYAALIQKTGSEAVIDSMSFNSNQLQRLSALMPEMPVGLLINSITSNESNPNKSVWSALRQVQGLNATFNVGYYGIGPNFLEAAHHRGLIVSPWTINNKTDYINLFLMGAFALTTDNTNWSADWAESLTPSQDKYELAVGERADLSAIVMTYKGEESTIQPDAVFLDGQELVEVDGSSVTAKQSGTAHVLLRYTSVIDASNRYDLYSGPVALEIQASGDEDGGNDGDNPGEDNGGDNPGEDNGGDTGGGTEGDDNGNSGGTNPNTPQNPTVVSDKLVAADGKVDAASLQQSLAANSTVQVTFAGERVEMAAESLLAASGNPSSQLVLVNDYATYRLPLAAIKLDELIEHSGGTAADVTLRITIREANGSEAAAIASAAARAGSALLNEGLASEVDAVGKSGQWLPVSLDYASTTREWVLDKAVNARKTTVVRLSPTGQLRFVPAVFAVADGKTTVSVKGQKMNSVYAVVENDKHFTDMTNHWAKDYVEALANKLIIRGVGNDRFDANRAISRAEFTALLVNALGLDTASADRSFADIDSSAWYAQGVSAAAAAGIISGYEDGTFRPGSVIKREEMAVMLLRAMEYAGVRNTAMEEQQAAALDKFADADQLPSWAKEQVGTAAALGVMEGMSSQTFGSGRRATRAEAAAVLTRLLLNAHFIE